MSNPCCRRAACRTLAVMLLTSQVTFGQGMLQKGSWELGGAISYSSERYESEHSYSYSDTYTYTTTTVEPDLSYFVSDGLSIGASLLYVRTDTDFSDGTGFAIGPRISYYFFPDNTKTPFGSVFARIGMEDWSMDGGDSSEGSFEDYGVTAGMLHAINRFVAFTAAVSYTRTHDHSRYRIGQTDREHDYHWNSLKFLLGFKIFHWAPNR